MATTVPNNPFNTQQPKADNTGIVGGAMQSGGEMAKIQDQLGSATSFGPVTVGQLPSNVGTSAPAAPNVATYSPTTRQVNQATGTAQGQVESILSKDSPLMERARTLAKQGMAQRGLVNSSMAQGAGVAAMIDRATPIALQDANAFNQADSDNQNALNQSGQFNAGEINRFGLQKGEQQFQAQQGDITRQFQTSERLGSQQFTGDFEVAKQNFSAAQSALDRAQQKYQVDKSIESQQALQQAQQQFQGAQSALERTQQTTLQRDQQGFLAGQSALDRGQQTALQAGQQQFQAAQQQIQNDFNMRVQQLQESGQDFRQARDIATREAMTRLEQAGVNNRFDQELALKSSQFNIEQNNLEKRQISANAMELEKMGLQIRANNAQIPTQFAANVSNTAMAGVNAILADGNLNADAKRAAIANVMNYANSQVAWAERFYNTTIPRINAPEISGPAPITTPTPPPPAAPD